MHEVVQEPQGHVSVVAAFVVGVVAAFVVGVVTFVVGVVAAFVVGIVTFVVGIVTFVVGVVTFVVGVVAAFVYSFVLFFFRERDRMRRSKEAWENVLALAKNSSQVILTSLLLLFHYAYYSTLFQFLYFSYFFHLSCL